MRIDKAEIEAIKRTHDLREVIEAHGIKLKKKGSNFVGLCPFHEEKTPSFTVNPKTRLFHCFGCNAGGDVIGFVSKKEGVGFREAVNRLGRQHTVDGRQGKAKNNGNGDQNPQSEIRIPQSVNRARLLNRVVSFYHQSFCEDRRALEYLESRGIRDNGIFSDFKLGFSNGTLLNATPDEGDIYAALKEIGILNERGHELFYGCVVFPVFDENRDCVGMYGRRLADGEVNHLYLPGPRRGVFNYQAARRSQSLILTESVIDALTLYQAGFKDVIPCYGVNGLTEDHLALFARHKTREVYICFDRDEAGEEGAKRIAGQLRDKNIVPYIVALPASSESDRKVDVNTFFLTAEAPEIFAGLLREANPQVSIQSDRLVKEKERHYEKTDAGFMIQYGERRYEVLGITREGVRLKATIKAIKQPSEPETRNSLADPSGRLGQAKLATAFHLDTVDLYSSRSRLLFAKACSGLFAEKEELIAGDVTRLIELCESWKPEGQEKAPVPRMTQAEEEEGLKFLKDPALFNRILADFETVGLTGEESNKLLGYLAAASRKLDEPLSVLIQSRSAAGKSTLQDAVILFVPPEDCVKYTRLTSQALFYKEEDSLTHKLLAVEEEHGAREASYSIRSIQLSRYLSIASTSKDPVTGKLKTEEYKVKGPVALMITTTEVELDYETANRFITLTIDESREMTERILKKQREQETLEGLIRKVEIDQVVKRHHSAQRLLRPLRVVNPFAPRLTFPAESLRARRDHKKYLGLIKAIAFLHQYQREIKTTDYEGQAIEYIEVVLDDIEKANRLAGEVFGRTLDELSPPSRALLKLIREMVEARGKEKGLDPREYHFTRKDIREWAKWSDFQIKCHVRQLEDLEYIYSVAGKRGKEYIYELLYSGGGEDDKPFFLGLAPVEELKKAAGSR